MKSVIEFLMRIRFNVIHKIHIANSQSMVAVWFLLVLVLVLQ